MNKRIRKKKDKFNFYLSGLKKSISTPLTWDVDDTTAAFISTILKKYIKNNNGHPSPTFKNIQEYHAKLQTIIDACDAYQTRWEVYGDTWQEDAGQRDAEHEIKLVEDFKKALHAFADLAPSLWW